LSRRTTSRDLLRRITNPRLLKGSFIALVGYILSPLSWWNDAFVNIPIALALAKLTAYFVNVDLYILFTIYYWLTNVAGLMMMYFGGEMIVTNGTQRERRSRGIARGLVFKTVLLNLKDK
jgi:hypothetical protein